MPAAWPLLPRSDAWRSGSGWASAKRAGGRLWVLPLPSQPPGKEVLLVPHQKHILLLLLVYKALQPLKENLLMAQFASNRFQVVEGFFNRKKIIIEKYKEAGMDRKWRWERGPPRRGGSVAPPPWPCASFAWMEGSWARQDTGNTQGRGSRRTPDGGEGGCRGEGKTKRQDHSPEEVKRLRSQQQDTIRTSGGQGNARTSFKKRRNKSSIKGGRRNLRKAESRKEKGTDRGRTRWEKKTSTQGERTSQKKITS